VPSDEQRPATDATHATDATDAWRRGRRRKLQVFSRTQPVSGDWEFARPSKLDPPAVGALPEFYAAGGSRRAVPFVDPDGADGHGLSLIWLRFAPNYPLPRHSHSTDCLYYIVAGEVHLGRRVLRAGEGFFVPADAPYGYTVGPEGVELLEFRATTVFDSQIRETPAGWRRILDAIRVNRDEWAGNDWGPETPPPGNGSRTPHRARPEAPAAGGGPR
jgi:hypothetical protein